MLFISCGFLFATNFVYISQDIDNADMVLEKGTRVEVLKISKNSLHVRLIAFINKKKELFFDKNFIFQLGELKNDSLSSGTHEFTFELKKDKVSEDAFSIWEDYEEFYYEACTQCHSAHETDEHTMLEWEGLFGAMVEQSQIDKEVGVKVLRYLKSHAKDGFVILK